MLVRRRLRGLIPAVAGDVVLFLDQHRQQFLSRHPHNQIGLIARIHPALANIPDDRAVIALGIGLTASVAKSTLRISICGFMTARPPTHSAGLESQSAWKSEAAAG